MMNHLIALRAVCMAAITILQATAAMESTTLTLDGNWRFQLDGANAGIAEAWYRKKLDDSVRLPGTTDENGKGLHNEKRHVDRLTRVWEWVGPAWYQREITIPETWRGKRIALFLERSKNSRLWVNESFCGSRDSLSAPHVFDVTAAMSPGTHTITLLVDNSKLPPVGPSHAVDERTQTNWNGIVGCMELRATDPVWIENLQVYPNAAKREALLRIDMGNITGKPARGTLTITGKSRNVKTPAAFATQIIDVEVAAGGSVIEFKYQPGAEVSLWDEFNPALLQVDLKLQTHAADAGFTADHTITFGMRDFTREGNRLRVNGRLVFLRGRVDCANYPLTGYAPMDRDSWRRILQIQKDWGLNHIRFHSWCPPAAAFEMADELGFYLQVELPNKRSAFNAADEKNAALHNFDFLDVNIDDGEVKLYDYAVREGELIFRHYGNHPSFTMFTLGNELGRNESMFSLVARFRNSNPRSLYAQGSNNMHWKPSLAEGDDFWVIAKTDNLTRPVRGSFHIHNNPPGHIENSPPSTLVDFSESIADVPVPVIGHETGEFQISPDFSEIGKFTGVLRAHNYEIFRDRLMKAGMLDQADDFVKASGALAAICYREDIEAALRTPEFGGFQLLDIMDFPGQGTALVGMLNVFMENKGIIEPENWRMFCSETVPLLRMEKYTWVKSETFTAKVQIAHYGSADLIDARVSAKLHGLADAPLTMAFPATTIKQGGITDIGPISLDLDAIPFKTPEVCMLVLEIEGTPYRNEYPLWIYPDEVDTSVPEGVVISRSFVDEDTQAHLEGGGRVLLLPELGNLPHSIPGAFATDFWSPMFAQGDRKRGDEPPPGTLGLLINPASPPGGNALGGFPSEFHSNWQWWHLVKNARPIILDDTHGDYRPIVQVIDNFDRNHKLGLIMETRVGKGALLICSIDLPALQDKPEARQLLHSLLRYASSPQFDPKQVIDAAILTKLLPKS